MGVDGAQKRQSSWKEFAVAERGGTSHGGSKLLSGGDNIYRPPHVRHQDNTLRAQQKSRELPVKPRRPDRAVYVPRAKRLMTSNDAEPKQTCKEENLQPDVTCSSVEYKKDNVEHECHTTHQNSIHNQTPKKIVRRDFCNVYTPPHARSSESCHRKDIHSDKVENKDNELLNSTNESVNSHSVPYTQHSCSVPNINSEVSSVDSVLNKKCSIIKPDLNNSTNEHFDLHSLNTHSHKDDLCSEELFNVVDSPGFIENKPIKEDVLVNNTVNNVNIERENCNIIIEDTNIELKKDLDYDESEFQRASEVINLSNRRIIKKTFVSDVLVISDPLTEESQSAHNTVINNATETDIEAKTPIENISPKQNVILSRDDNDWDTLFDDDGECLDPSLLTQLTDTVGKVHIQKPRNSYQQYQSRGQIMLSGPQDEMFGHVIEVYNFPQDFKTHDLLSVFASFKDAGFEIKWVDDTHALAVFSSAKIAAEVLAYDHPIVRTRPLNEATVESRQKARKSAEFLQPYRPRPETCTALARRLVTGALGMKLSTAKQERQEERRIIKEAREKKRQAALLREAAWEGTLENQTDDAN